MKETGPNNKRNTLIFKGAIIILLWFRILVMVSGRWLGTDTWFMLALGREIVENGVPTTNPFFLGPTIETMVPQWLYDVALYWLQDNFGYYAMLIIPLISLVAGSVLLYGVFRLYNVDRFVSVLLVSVYWYLNWGDITVRPNIPTVTLVILQIYLLEKYAKTGKYVYLAFIPAISVFEMNIHCLLWPLHLCIMAAYICPQFRMPLFLEKHTYRIKPLVYTAIFTFLAGLINPYGLQGVLAFIGSTSPESCALIGEMANPTILSGEALFQVLGAGVILYVLTKRKIGYQHFYIFCGLLLLGIMHKRNDIWGLLGITLAGCVLLKDTNFSKVYERTAPKTLLGFWPFIIFYALCIIGHPKPDQPEDENLNTPHSVIAYIRENTPDCRAVFTEDDCGGFFEWYGYKTYMDTRADAFMPTYTGGHNILREYLMMTYLSDFSGIEAVLQKYDFEYAYIYNSSRLNLYFDNSEEYEQVLRVREMYDYDGYKTSPPQNVGILYRKVER